MEEKGAGYLSLTPVRLRRGANDLAWRLTAEEDVGDLRSYWALVKRPEAFARPEWVTTHDEPRRDSLLRFAVKVHLPFQPVRTLLQLGADAPARLVINGIEVGRQGGFDPYNVTERMQPYEVTTLRRGDNQIVVDVQDVGRRASILVDALVHGPDGSRMSVATGSQWRVRRDDGPWTPACLRRRQWLDPAWSHLWRRAHPLPGAMWLEDENAPDVVIPVTPDAYLPEERSEWFRWIVPPGAAKAILPVFGEVELWIDGEPVRVERKEPAPSFRTGEEPCHYEAVLPRPDGVKRVAVMRLAPFRGRTGGGVFAGSVSYEWQEGTILLGDWTTQGLEAYSGAVRYRGAFELRQVPRGRRITLDLGRVRGTAEVRVNGTSVGTRVWSPYRFDITPAVRCGVNDVEIVVCNTLGPYLKAASPTPYVFPGQEQSGVYGPVRVLAR